MTNSQTSSSQHRRSPSKVGEHYNGPTYQSWRAMKTRCFNPNYRSFEYYGGRGIQVCERWLRFENFLADMGERPKGLTLDRIDNNGNYEPTNCRWATWKEQAQSKRPSWPRKAKVT